MVRRRPEPAGEWINGEMQVVDQLIEDRLTLFLLPQRRSDRIGIGADGVAEPGIRFELPRPGSADRESFPRFSADLRLIIFNVGAF